MHGLAGIASMDLPGTAAGSSGWGRESDEGNAGTQSIGSAVIDVTSGDYFALVARQSSAWTKNVAAHRLFEVVD